MIIVKFLKSAIREATEALNIPLLLNLLSSLDIWIGGCSYNGGNVQVAVVKKRGHGVTGWV